MSGEEERVDPQVTEAIRNWVNEGLAHVRGCDPGANAQRCTCGYVEVRQLLRGASPAAFDPPAMTQTSDLKPQTSSKTAFRVAWEAWNLVSSMDEDEAAREMLDAAVGALAGDELDVVGHVIARLQLGRERYGKLDLGNEQRDLVREALEEAADGFVYAISECIRVERRRGSPLQVVATFPVVPRGLEEEFCPVCSGRVRRLIDSDPECAAGHSWPRGTGIRK